MSNLLLPFVSILVMGLGATLTFDLWVLFLRLAIKIPASNICLVGRWLRYMPEGIFKHSNLVSAAPRSAECVIGWVAHYLIGILFAAAFIAIAGSSWLQRPTLLPAVGFGIVTVLAPLFIMQPLFGLGVAASRTSNPAQARLRSLMNHTVFGVGLYLFGLGLSSVR
jgi:hypothetical protein